MWTCEDCSLSFSDLVHYNAHRKQDHANKGPHVCSECGKEYSYPSLLKQHISFVHLGESTACEVCERSFSRTSHLLRHYRQLHKDFYKKMVEEGKIRPRRSRKLS